MIEYGPDDPNDGDAMRAKFAQVAAIRHTQLIERVSNTAVAQLAGDS